MEERTDTHPARRCLGSIGNTGLRRICGMMLALSWLAAPVAPALAKTATNHIAVGATVQPYAHLTATQPKQLIIANKDVNLGYVNVPNGSNPSGTQLTIKTNDHAGYTLVFQVAPAEQALFKSIQVFGLGTTVTLPATGGKVTMTFPGPTVNLSLTYRFNLVNSLKDGTYAWPLTILSQPD
ncbi:MULTISPECIES: hypothetical protein [Ralstonia solanacearum species complex]|uniref:hypothetical protein n=1 Tax=Ralstonia solanacearum species complex TaxID=3116862 RepID=UPI000E56B618|nr:hypothetical protein [Ralstonia solanacearum]BEU72109.1 hypothetical protein MAFF211271_16640 [Ralstonia pseudosolanacearum]AXV77006.1 hypothetical protein CJO76_08490 [Ralstonia solanacearum]AXV91020.1 hypothetical protein CJO79_08470 [Ralstonia solanacearum]AXW19169.1 hypothetical protein CJO85_08520 [Ralstonia solanacearum]AXW62075.1 hypothetical protein CJO94_09050 [Ralstonia solanacearum]